MLRTLLKRCLAQLLRLLQWADDHKRDKYLAKKAKKTVDPWSYWSDSKRDQVRASNKLILQQYGYAVFSGTGAIIAWASFDFLHVTEWHAASSYLLVQILFTLAEIVYVLCVIGTIGVGGSLICLHLVLFSGFRWEVRWMMRSLPDDFTFAKLDKADQDRLSNLLKREGVLSARRRTHQVLLDGLIQSYPREDETKTVQGNELVSQSS